MLGWLKKLFSRRDAPEREVDPAQITLRKGDRYSAVKALQKELKEAGYNPGPIDSIFGLKTESAVKKFQEDKGLVIDGVVGGKTWDLLLKEDSSDDENPESPRDNEDSKPEDSKDNDQTKYEKDEEKLYYPKAIRSKYKLKTRGYYREGYPRGAVVHFTAGRSRKKPEGGSKNADSHIEQGVRSVRSAANKKAYTYFVIDRDGNVHQNFSLNKWGYHAGKSRWTGLGNSVSDKLVGIEIQNAGRLREHYQNSSKGIKHKCPEGKLAAWFTRPKLGDTFFDKKTESRYSQGDDNQLRGWYHAYSPEQEAGLIELLIWMKRNNPDVFKFEYVLGHDEVAGLKGIGYHRKNDPGAALSMTMTQFRKKLELEYKKRYS